MSTDQDEQLALVLEELLERARKGEAVPIESVASQYPEIATELTELWTAAMVAEAVAGGTKASDSDQPLPTHLEPPSTLPHAPSPSQEHPKCLGNFELLEEIGRGGMGVVFRARQTNLDREIAVKLILGGELATEVQRNRFQAEAEAVAQLDHPHIVPIYDVRDVDGQLCFSMPLVEGESLASRLAQGPVPSREAAEILVKVARAIHYAHRCGIVHRDLKPANILIDKRFEPHVTDFGLAKRISADATHSHSGSVIGTPAYMAPEQAVKDRGTVGPPADIYSLGSLLYALVTGRPPFIAPSPVDVVLLVLEQDPLPPRLLNRRVDRDLEMIILHCLQKPPELRYESAEALADDLQAYLDGEPIKARSGQMGQIVARLFRETHHASLLENWGLLWMWHALVLLVICITTDGFHHLRGTWAQMDTAFPYVALWGGALAIWSPIFWKLRHQAGPVTAVERQIAHVWGASIVSVVLLFVVEHLLALPVLTLSPVLPLISGTVFLVKAGILAGTFYLHAIALFLTAPLMAWLQSQSWDFSITLFGLIVALTFFLPGWKYHRQAQRQAASRLSAN